VRVKSDAMPLSRTVIMLFGIHSDQRRADANAFADVTQSQFLKPLQMRTIPENNEFL